MNYSKLWIAIVVVAFATNSLSAQDSNEVDTIRNYPPNLIVKDQVDVALMSIKWQQKRLQNRLNELKKGKKKFTSEIENLQDERDALTESLPAELRMLDQATRSQLIGNAMQKMLAAKLEIAAKKSTLEEIGKKLDGTKADDSANISGQIKEKVSKLNENNLQAAIDVARAKIEEAEANYANSKKLVSKGLVTQMEMKRSEVALQIALSELRAAQSQLEIQKLNERADSAKEMTAARLELAPLEAQLKTLEDFLRSLSSSSDVFRKTDKLDRYIRLMDKDLQVFATEIGRATREFDELEVLRVSIEDAVKEKGTYQEK